MSLHHNGDNGYLFVNGKEMYKFKVKANNKNVDLPSQFCLGSMSNKFCAIYSTKVSLKENGYDFSVDYNAVDKFDILNIRE